MSLAGKSWQAWIAQYQQSHQNSVNQFCHIIGIPLIVIALGLFLGVVFNLLSWQLPLVLFLVGWGFQFLGHVFEGKPPEFFNDWRFVFVGLRWWLFKVRQWLLKY